VKSAPVVSWKLDPLIACLQHGNLEFAAETLKDGTVPRRGPTAPSTHRNASRRDTITGEMAAAADKFRETFRIAHMDALRGRRYGPNTGRLREDGRIHDVGQAGAIDQLGGQDSIAAWCIWAIVGLEIPISRWAVDHAGINRHAGAGVLLPALGILAAYFGGGDQRHDCDGVSHVR